MKRSRIELNPKETASSKSETENKISYGEGGEPVAKRTKLNTSSEGLGGRSMKTQAKKKKGANVGPPNQPKYNDEITRNAESYGFKAANLMFLKDKLTDYEEPLIPDITVEVPSFFPISDQEMTAFFDQYGPEWRDLWNEFVVAFRQQDDQSIIEAKAKECIKAWQGCILKALTNNTISQETVNTIQALVGEGELLMVRSTGKEDSTDMSNPGGNESKDCVQPIAEEISSAIGEVIASYGGEKSASQRLKSGDDITTFVFCPVFIQKMIGGELYRRNDPHAVVYSGVIYSGHGCTRIQAAPGHGELIVNSKGNFDNYYVTSKNIIYGEVRAKHFRLIPGTENDEKKTKLEQCDNDNELKYHSTLDETVTLYLHNLAQYIEKIYNMRMDIEFVYDPSRRVVHVVQARPIPLGDRRNLRPSAISPEFMSEVAQKGAQVINGQTVTPEVNQAAVITSPEEILVCHTIGEALDQYLKGNGKIKAVVIQKDAPDTSHEAGEFSLKAIPVIQVDNISKVQMLVSGLSTGQPIIIDPQRKKIVQIPQNLCPHTEAADVEEVFYEKGIVKEGIFKSTLTAHVTPYKHNFGDVSYEFHENICSDIKSEDLGSLLHRVRSGDKEATEKLFSFLFHIISMESDYPATNSYKTLMENLDKLSNPKFGENNDEGRRILVSILQLVVKLRKDGSINQELFTQILISGGELFISLELLENQAYKQEVLVEYLNVLEKFLGGLSSEFKKDVLSESMVRSLSNKHHELAALRFVEGLSFSENQKVYFVELSKLGRFLLNDESKECWYAFCIDICKTETGAAILGTMVAKIVKQNLHENWINISFVEKFLNNNRDSKITLTELQSELDLALSESAGFDKAAKLILSIESQIPLWREPANFDKLYVYFKKTLDEINEILKYNKNSSLITRISLLQHVSHLSEVIDQTIKSLQKSTLYDANTELQTERFMLMVNELYNLMKTWTDHGQFPVSTREKIIRDMDHFFNNKKTSFDKAELSPSGFFEVNAVTMDQPGLLPRGWGRGFFSRCKTAADFFTLVHQNWIVSIGALSKRAGQSLRSGYPPLLKQIDDNLSKYSANFVFSQLNYPNITLHYNVPLRDHSGRILLEYDYVRNKANLRFMMFGENENMRWVRSEMHSSMKLYSMPDVKMIQPPYYSANKHAFDFEVAIENEKHVAFVTNLIRDLTAISMATSEKWTFRTMETRLLEAMTLDKLKSMIDHYNRFIIDYPLSVYYFEHKLVFLQYFLESKSEDFDVNNFLLEHESILTNPECATLYDKIIDDFENQIKWDYRKDDMSFSIFELSIRFSMDEILRLNIENIVCEHPNFILLSILKALRRGSYFKEKSSQCLEIAIRLINEKGAIFNIRSIKDWGAISSKLVENPDYWPQLLQILHPKNCDLKILNQIVDTERNCDSKLIKKISNAEKHKAFAELLAKQIDEAR